MADHATELARGQCVIPIFLDNTVLAHRLSSKVFHRFGVISLICGRHRALDVFDFSSYTLRLRPTSEQRLIAEELVSFSERCPETLLLLVPCSKKATELCERFSSSLESRFVTVSPSDLLNTSPLYEIAVRSDG